MVPLLYLFFVRAAVVSYLAGFFGHCLLLISHGFSASGRLYLVYVTFPGYLHLYFAIAEGRQNSVCLRESVPSRRTTSGR